MIFFSALIKSWSLIKQKLSGRAGDRNSIAPCPTHCFFICWDILALHFYKMPWNAFLLLIHSYIKKKKPAKNGQKYCEIWRPSIFMWLSEEARFISDLQPASLPAPSFPQTQKAVRAWFMDCVIIISLTWGIQLYTMLVHYMLCLPPPLGFQFLLCAVAFDSSG